MDCGWGVVIAAIALVADVDGFLSFGERIGVLSSPSEEIGELQLVNLDFKSTIEKGTNRTQGANLATIQAIVRTTGNERIWVGVDSVSGNLGNVQCEAEGHSWPVLPLPRGVQLEVTACTISTPIEPGERKDGRIDLVLRYGPTPTGLTKELRIKGGISVMAVDQGGRSTWVPDGDSAIPYGVAAAPALLRPGESGLDAATADPTRKAQM